MRMNNLAPRFADLEQRQCWRMPSGVGVCVTHISL